jgi:hypothetical protein
MRAKTMVLNNTLEVTTVDEEEDCSKNRSLRNATNHCGEK